ncbi:trypsin-like serine protease [Amycolatopsis sp. cg5]|uniref:trypsin-like serine protease n=1 Tax=Amycolatopsis sp. cg5 TaxID=3238802 RepID=UPI003526ABF1
MSRKTLNKAGRTALAVAGLAATLLAAPASAVSGGTEVTAASQPYLARIQIGGIGAVDGRACSGALVAPQWVITAATCFGAKAADGYRIASPAPAIAATATLLGKQPVAITRVVSPGGRDVALARLAAANTTVTPVPLSTTAPVAGTAVTASGFGRTGNEWAPVAPHKAGFTVSESTDTTFSLTGPGDTCKGDAGGPTLATAPTGSVLAGVSSSSWQHGCLGENPEQQGSTATRTDDLVDWIRAQSDPLNSWYFLPGAERVIAQAPAARAALAGHSGSLTGKTATDLVTRRPSDAMLFAYENKLSPVVGEQSYKPAAAIGTSWNIYNLLQQADLDGDGVADLLARATNGDLYGYLGTGKIDGTSGTLKSRVLIGRSWNTYSSIFAADTNGDGKAEVFGIAADAGDPARLALWGYVNNGFNGLDTLSARVNVATGGKDVVPGGFADFTGDGNPDLFMITNRATGTNDLAVLDRYAGGAYSDGAPMRPSTYKVGSGWTSKQLLTLGDINGDRRPDIIGTTTAGALNAYVHSGTFVRTPGQGAQTFSAPILIGRSSWETMDVLT